MSTDLTGVFEAERSRLIRVAYSIIGTLAEAEDVVQEAWLRLERVEVKPDDPVGWLVTVTSRIALDVLGSARHRRETYVGEWLPEPVVDVDLADRVTLDESVSMALLVVLEQLSPAERTAFLLHDVFGMPFDEVADAVGRTPAAVRQLASRARKHVNDAKPVTTASRAEQERLIGAFALAVGTGDLEALVKVLDPDVEWRSDGGGKVAASRHPVFGAERVAKAFIGFRRVFEQRGRLDESDMAIAQVNGEPGLLMVEPGGVRSVLAFTVHDGRITRIDVVRNPDKLTRVPPLG